MALVWRARATLGFNLRHPPAAEAIYLSFVYISAVCLQVVDTVLRSHAVQLIAVDSVAALLPRAEHEGDIGMAQVGRRVLLLCMMLYTVQPLLS